MRCTNFVSSLLTLVCLLHYQSIFIIFYHHRLSHSTRLLCLFCSLSLLWIRFITLILPSFFLMWPQHTHTKNLTQDSSSFCVCGCVKIIYFFLHSPHNQTAHSLTVASSLHNISFTFIFIRGNTHTFIAVRHTEMKWKSKQGCRSIVSLLMLMEYNFICWFDLFAEVIWI